MVVKMNKIDTLCFGKEDYQRVVGRTIEKVTNSVNNVNKNMLQNKNVTDDLLWRFQSGMLDNAPEDKDRLISLLIEERNYQTDMNKFNIPPKIRRSVVKDMLNEYEGVNLTPAQSE